MTEVDWQRVAMDLHRLLDANDNDKAMAFKILGGMRFEVVHVMPTSGTFVELGEPVRATLTDFVAELRATVRVTRDELSLICQIQGIADEGNLMVPSEEPK